MEEYSLAINVLAHWSLWFKDPISNASQIDPNGLYLTQDNMSDTFLVSFLIMLLVQNNFVNNQHVISNKLQRSKYQLASRKQQAASKKQQKLLYMINLTV